MRSLLILTLLFITNLAFSQVNIPPAKIGEHPDYAAYQQAKRDKNLTLALQTAANLVETYPGNSQAFQLAASALYDSNKPQDAVDFAKWAVAYNSYDGAGSFYGFTYSVFANQPLEAERFIRNLQALGQDAAGME